MNKLEELSQKMCAKATQLKYRVNELDRDTFWISFGGQYIEKVWRSNGKKASMLDKSMYETCLYMATDGEYNITDYDTYWDYEADCLKGDRYVHV